MRRALPTALAALLCAAALCAPAPAAAEEGQAAWQLSLTALPSNLSPGAHGTLLSGPEYLVLATNVGAKPSSGQVTLTDALPPEVSPEGPPSCVIANGGGTCTGGCVLTAASVTCTTEAPVPPGASLQVGIALAVAPGAHGTAIDEATAEGGGAGAADTAQLATPITTATQPFGFLPGFKAPLSQADGSPAALAASHPYQLTADFGFPTESAGGNALGATGHLRDLSLELPPGELVDPAATPVRCTEAELTAESGPESCPAASQVGSVTVFTIIAGPSTYTSPLYNMVPPPGTPAELGFDAIGAGLFVHIAGEVRSESDYGITGLTPDTLALVNNPIFGARAQLWGDPSAEAHDQARKGTSVEAQKTAMLSAPGRCSGSPEVTTAKADSWEEPSPPFAPAEASYESADLEGNPVSLSGCNALSYQPTISAQPTTDLADSPSGLEVDLHQPQQAPHLEPLSGRATAELKNATVTLPEGMVVNPSQANGLEACSEEQIGYLSEDGEAGIHFSKAPQSCPDAAKLGSLEVTTPLLAEYRNEGTELETDPETGAPIPRPLHGSVYLAKPYQNPFGSLLAIYLTVEDPASGTFAKLAGKVEPDPKTGRLKTVFEENPELPLEDVKLKLFDGARASLITPQTCGTHTTSSDLTPWSSPEGQDAHPESSFQTTAEPGGGSCPQGEGAAKNAPAFQAGTLAPAAGAYSPFVLKLSREDGSQRIAGIDATLPPGLSGKLAGIAECTDAQLAQAKAREAPNQGALEKSDPSCPASSEVGTVDVAAGAGPTPFHTQGHAYLAGPYKGAPLSLAVIVPAVAGPFDLGDVVSRVALYLNPATAQIHAVSDPLPQILDGIPLDVRSIALTMGRPQFTLNPTSCDPMSIVGSETSALGQSAALSNPFQVGGCSSLPFKPKLSLKLKGGTKRAAHPKLIATLSAKPGEANVAMAQVKLPPSAFLDQAHIRTVCTRVQFAANQCPEGSIYGTAEATTPLLSYPLTGNVYLRSSNNKLPDLIVALKGPAYQPIEIDLDGRTDSVHGALRNTFEAVPDAPVSTFRLELFGGKRGLVINSRNLCKHAYRAEVNLTGQNGKAFDTTPAVGTSCKGKGKKGHRGGGRSHRHG